MRWFQALLPHEDSFFDQFEAHARPVVQGAGAVLSSIRAPILP